MERRGGRFAGWRCLVVLGDAKMRDIYGRVLAAGGADVLQWKSVQSLGEEFMPNKVKLKYSKGVNYKLYWKLHKYLGTGRRWLPDSWAGLTLIGDAPLSYLAAWGTSQI